jgi:glycine cleavage system H protein
MSETKDIDYATDRKYAETHEWVKMEGGLAVIGISDYAQDALGDVVFVELPKVGATFKAGASFGVVESVKAASDIYTPISGTVEAVNEKLSNAPETLNKDALGEGWIAKLRPSNPSEMDKLLDAPTYKKKIESGEIH